MSTSKHYKLNSNFMQKLGVTFDMLRTLKNKLSKKEVNHYLQLGLQNFKNLKNKVPILGTNGKPLRFKVGGKTVMEMYEPAFKEGYEPVEGTEHIFVKPQMNKTRKQNGGNALGIMSIVGVVLYLLIQAGNSGSFGSSTPTQTTTTQTPVQEAPVQEAPVTTAY